MKLHLKYASVVALPMALVFSTFSMQGQTTQNANASPNQSTQPASPLPVSTQPSQSGNAAAQGESLADRARKAKRANSQNQSAGRPKNFNQDNLAAATSGKTHSSKGRKPKRNGLHKTS